MNNSNVYFILLMVFAVLISSVSQIVLKKSANKTYKNIFYEYFNAPVIISYTVFVLATLINVVCLRWVPLSYAPIIESTGYIFILILGRIFLNEKISKEKLIGVAIIIFGIIIFAL